MSLDLTDDQSTLVQIMAWCHPSTSHYLSQCWPKSMSPYGITRAQWVEQNYVRQPIKTWERRPFYHMSARENCSQIRNIYPISWVLMSWRCKEPGHQQPWYCWYARQSDPVIFQLDHHRLLHQVFRKTGDLILKTGNLLDILHRYYRLPRNLLHQFFICMNVVKCCLPLFRHVCHNQYRLGN